MGGSIWVSILLNIINYWGDEAQNLQLFWWHTPQRSGWGTRGTLARQRNGLTGALGCSIRGSANLCSLKSLGKTILASSSKLRATQLESSFTEKALGVLLDTKFNKRQQCALQARKVNGNVTAEALAVQACSHAIHWPWDLVVIT